MTLDDLAHEVRNGLGGIKLAIRHCDKDCPNLFHKTEVRQTIVHNCNRIERALIVCEAALKNGEIDAFFGDQSIIVHKVNTLNLGSELRLTNQLLTVEKQGLALARGDSEFRLLVDQILSAMYQNGFMKRIYEQTLPNLQPGQAMQALHMIAPEIP